MTNCPDGLRLRSIGVAAGNPKIEQPRSAPAKIARIFIVTNSWEQSSCSASIGEDDREFFCKKSETLACFSRLILRTKNRLMNTKRILLSVVTGLILTGSLAMAAPGNDRAGSKAKVR